MNFHLEWFCVYYLREGSSLFLFCILLKTATLSFIDNTILLNYIVTFVTKSSFVVYGWTFSGFLLYFINLFILTTVSHYCLTVNLEIRKCKAYNLQVYNFNGKLLNIFRFMCQTNITSFNLKKDIFCEKNLKYRICK